MKLFKRKGRKFWYYEFSIGDHKFGPKTTKCDHKADAKRVADIAFNAAIQELKRSTTGSLEITLGEAARLWWDFVGSRSRDSQNNQSRLRKLFGEATGRSLKSQGGLRRDQLFHTLTSRDLQTLVAGRLKDGLAGGTINRELALLQAMEREARKGGFSVPGLDYRAFKQPERQRMRYATQEQIKQLLKELDPTREIPGQPKYGERHPATQRRLDDQYDFVVLLVDTGFRYNEIAMLPWSSVDLEAGTITVSIQKKKSQTLVTRHLTKRAKEVLRRREDFKVNRYVFPSEDGKSHRSKATSGIRKAIQRVGLNDDKNLVNELGKFVPHSFRDSFASALIQKDFDLYEVQGVLAHSSPVTTQKYAHLQASTLGKRAAAALEETLEETEVDE